MNIITYIRMDFWRNFRNFGNTFFVVGLPTALFIFFGVNMEWSDAPVNDGNVSSWIMIAMAVYGAATATTALAGSAAVELQQGWGRQLALTAMPHGMFVVAKAVIALSMAVLPVLVLFLVGFFTTSDMPWSTWILTGVLAVVGSLPFAIYGLAIGLSFRSDAAVGAASGILVIFGFLGNAFFPLEGTLLDVGRLTPMYGPVALARYPLTEGELFGTMGALGVSDPLWMILLNILAWSAVFGTACLLLRRRVTARR